MHYEDALKFVIARLTVDPEIFVGDNRAEADVWIPRAVQLFLTQENPDNPNFHRPEYCQYGDHRGEFDHVCIAFYDAAAELCRRGIFRLGDRCKMALGGSPVYTLSDAYSFTVAGSEWLRRATGRYLPTAPGR